MRTPPKPIYEHLAAAAMEAVTHYNAQLARVWAARDAVGRERERIEADALAGAVDASGLKRRAEQARLDLLQADLDELRLLRSLPEIERMTKSDHSSERDRLDKRAGKIEAELTAKLSKIGMTTDQIDSAVNCDPAYCAATQARDAAYLMAAAGLSDSTEGQRRDELAQAISYAVARL